MGLLLSRAVCTHRNTQQGLAPPLFSAHRIRLTEAGTNGSCCLPDPPVKRERQGRRPADGHDAGLIQDSGKWQTFFTLIQGMHYAKKTF